MTITALAATARTPEPAPTLTVRADAPIEGLVAAARAGDERAWDAIVRRFGGAISGVTFGFRLCEADAQDVAQSTWLRLFLNIEGIEDPASLRAWLVTTARRESLRVLQRQTCEIPVEEATPGAVVDAQAADERLVLEERRHAVRRAVEDLPERPRTLMRLLLTRPDSSYEEVGARLGMPVGSIGPTRARALDRVGSHPAVARLMR